MRRTACRGRRVLGASRELGALLFDLSVDDLSQPETVFQIGVVPVRIDLLTSISGVGFEEAWAGRLPGTIEGVAFGVIGREDLLRNKRATGRPKDLLDAETLAASRRID